MQKRRAGRARHGPGVCGGGGTGGVDAGEDGVEDSGGVEGVGGGGAAGGPDGIGGAEGGYAFEPFF